MTQTLDQLQEAVERARSKLDDAVYNLEEAIRGMLREAGYDSTTHVAPGSWECSESPLGICIYNNHEDPCLDECVVCGDPEERK